METIPIHKSTIIRPFTQYLGELGAPVNRIMRQVKLPALGIEDPECYVSSQAFWSFVEIMAAKERITKLGFLVGENAGATAVDPNFSLVLSRSPTLYHGLIKTCRAAHAEISRTKMHVYNPEPGMTRFCHQTSFGIEHPIHHQLEWFALMVMIGIVREFAGPTWLPEEIGMMSFKNPGRAIKINFPGCHFLNGQVCGFIGIKTELMSLPSRTKIHQEIIASCAKSTSNILGEPADDFIGSLKQVMHGYLGEGTPHIALAAEIAGTSVRSLQRELAKSKLTYLELLAQIRFAKASRLLNDRDLSINEIAYKLGYTDASHFTHAFRRIAGMSPSEYRRSIKNP